MSGIKFICDECGREFVIPVEHYEGQFDHPPSVPICADCTEADEVCVSCANERRVWVRSSDPQDDYEVPCPECNADGDGFSKSELAYISRIRQRNAKFWRVGTARQQQEDRS